MEGPTAGTHFIVVTHENHTFDQYFGLYPGADGIPAGVVQRDRQGRPVAPWPVRTPWFNLLHDPDHSWTAIHAAWAQGRMDGFARVNGRAALAYYLPSLVAPYWRLARRGVLLDRYFCSVLGPTLPNRLYLVSGTSAGLRDDPALGPRRGFEQETVFDQLQRIGVGWAYYIGDWRPRCQLPARLELLCPLLWFPRFRSRPALREGLRPASRFFADVARGRLPAVAFFAPGWTRSEHPRTLLAPGMAELERMVQALEGSRYRDRWVLVANFDEGGGYFDHVPPPQVDAFGLGMRVPALVLGRGLPAGRVNHTVFDHTSILRTIQDRYRLPPLTPRNAWAQGLAVLWGGNGYGR